MNKVPWKDMIECGLAILGLILFVLVTALLSGCAGTKSRSIEARGMYASDTGQLAIGAVTVDAVPEEGESAIIHYSEDTAWLSPTTKTHKIDVFLTGATSAQHAKDIASEICDAFVAVKDAGGARLSCPTDADATSASLPDCEQCNVPAARCTDCED